MNDDKLMELLDLAAEQYAPPPGKQAAVLNRIIKKQDGVVNRTFVQMLEALGYDIELTYVKRGAE